MRSLFLVLISLFFVPELFAQDYVDGVELKDTPTVGHASVVEGTVWQWCAGEVKRPLLAGDSFAKNCYLTTGKASYVKGLLVDNSLFHIGENSAIRVSEDSPKIYSIDFKQGQIRLLNFKKSKLVKTNSGNYTARKGEFIWSSGEDTEVGEQFFVISGKAVYEKEVIGATKDLRLSDKVSSNDDTTKLWRKYFLGLQSPSLPEYRPKFTERKIASIESPVSSEIEEFNEFLEEESAKKPEVKKRIWVHDIVYDAVLKAVEQASLKKANEIMPDAIEAASDGLVWEVANRSVIKWATKYAYVAGAKEVPRSVASSLKEADVEDINLYDRDLYQKSAEEIATIRSYRRAKSAAEIGGYNRGWREAQKYAMELIPEIVLPVVSELIYLEAKLAGTQAANGIMKKTKLIMTEDVGQLVEHLSQVASKKIALSRINKFSAYYTEVAAKKAASEIAKSSSEEIASFVARKASNTAGRIMQKKIAEKRAKSVARSVASRNKKNEAFKAQSHSSKTMRETSR